MYKNNKYEEMRVPNKKQWWVLWILPRCIELVLGDDNMEDEVFEKYFERIYYECIYPFMAQDEYDYGKEKLKQILEEIESNAIKKAPRHELQVELFEIDEPF